MFCQLDMLRHCLAPSLRRQLNELPKSLDETYERILEEIESTNQGHHARRLLHCLAVALRPLRVEELAEVLAFDLDETEGEIPQHHPEWRWEDQEQAVLSACSSLISIVKWYFGSRVVQFSHFSVKEYLTSNRLSAASGDVLQYHILPEPAHLILARACLGVLLSLDSCANNESDLDNIEIDRRDEGIPLLKYAAEHWFSHAQVGRVSSCLKDAMERLFDSSKPYFSAWIRRYEVDSDHRPRLSAWPVLKPTPLYCAARCGFHDLVQHLIVKYPEQVNYRGGDFRYPLVAALSRGHFRIAELLLENGARVNVRGDPPLCFTHYFFDDHRIHAVKFLLKHGADVNAMSELRNLTPLCLATFRGCLEVTQMLLEHGAEVDRPNIEGQTPLHLVSTKMDPDLPGEGERSILARLLVDNGADVNAQDEHERTPLHFASYHGRPEIARLLLDHGANPQAENIQGRSPLHEVSQGNCRITCHGQLCAGSTNGVFDPQVALDVALLLLERGADVNAPDKDLVTPLHLASFVGVSEITQLLLDHGATANVENIHGQTPLHLLSQGELLSLENHGLTRLLLGLGLEVNARDKDLSTPLHFACSHRNFEIALLLLDHGAELNARNADGETPLHHVSRSKTSVHDDPRVAQTLLERGADVNARNKDEETPFHLASESYLSMPPIIQLLLDHGAEADARRADGQTPLHRASRPDIMQLLLEHGADVNSRDNDQATPLHWATDNSKRRIVQPLLDQGADPEAQNADGQTPLHRVSHPDTARVLLNHGVDINARDKDQATPLHLASYHGRVDVADVLLDQWAQSDAEDVQGQSPLHQVLLGGHHYEVMMASWPRGTRKYHAVAVLRLAGRLLEHGVDVNAQNKVGETPLHIASRLRLLEMARILLEHGAWVDLENAEGKTPLQLATGRKGKAMRRLLSEYSVEI